MVFFSNKLGELTCLSRLRILNFTGDGLHIWAKIMLKIEPLRFSIAKKASRLLFWFKMFIPEAYVDRHRVFDFDRFLLSTDQFVDLDDMLPYCFKLKIKYETSNEIWDWIVNNLSDTWLPISDMRTLDNPRGAYTKQQIDEKIFMFEYYFLDELDATHFKLRWSEYEKVAF